ncbi:hypothetical protein OSB04_001842 [Centaurea solstitialis]|uniref:Uncharacterized protein n=1 Tax=Centaurea solstitialis TaxID=347529 RepID=A0AA38U4D2_9ASTR|nr:hypothetical protein OSB04_001842 [Centaurea solstitialis]
MKKIVEEKLRGEEFVEIGVGKLSKVDQEDNIEQSESRRQHRGTYLREMKKIVEEKLRGEEFVEIGVGKLSKVNQEDNIERVFKVEYLEVVWPLGKSCNNQCLGLWAYTLRSHPHQATSGFFILAALTTCHHAGFITKQPSQHPTVRTVDLTPKPVLFSGNFSNDTIQLPDVLHVPGLARGLVSLTQLQEMGLLISFDFSCYVIQDPKTKQILGKGHRVGRVLEVVYLRLPLSSSYTNLTASVSKSPFLDLWHARLGRLSSARVQLLANSGLLGNITSNAVSCLSCKLGKHHALPFELNDYKYASAFDLIHFDVWGPAPHPSMGGCRTTSDLYYLCPHDTNSIPKPIKILRADNAMEYKESSLIVFLRSQGTISQYSCLGTSPKNGRAERKHRHILDTIRTLLISAKSQNVFGLQPHEHTKLQPRSRLCLFLGYGIEHKGYCCWDPISKHSSISLDLESSTFTPNPEADAPVASPAPSIPPPVPIASPTPKAPAHVPIPPPTQSSVPTSRSTSKPSVESTVLDHHHQRMYAVRTGSHCQAAMQEELQALDKAQTWDSFPLPPGKRPIGSKWVFKIKTKSDGSIDRYKASLVAKGFNQEYGIDYEEIFSPVARVTFVCSLLAIAATKRWPLFQMDVKNVFLNGDLSEEVYMTSPPGVSLPMGTFVGFEKLSMVSNKLLKLGLKNSAPRSSIWVSLQVTMILGVYSDSAGITLLKQSLSASFKMKDLGKLHYFLGLEVLFDSIGTYLCQAKYISDLLSRAGITVQKVVSTTLEPNLHLTPNAGPPLNNPTLYRQLVGSLVYFTVTRPDIAYAVHTVSQFMSTPCSDNYVVVLRILRYLKGTMFQGLYFSSTSSLILQGFSDADWDSDMTDRPSTTGFCFFLGDSLISWHSKK